MNKTVTLECPNCREKNKYEVDASGVTSVKCLDVSCQNIFIHSSKQPRDEPTMLCPVCDMPVGKFYGSFDSGYECVIHGKVDPVAKPVSSKASKKRRTLLDVCDDLLPQIRDIEMTPCVPFNDPRKSKKMSGNPRAFCETCDNFLLQDEIDPDTTECPNCGTALTWPNGRPALTSVERQEIAGMPRIKFHCGRDWQNRNHGVLFGVYWNKNNEAKLGEVVYLKAIEITFYKPIKFGRRNFK